ncbi:uncharacterized protein LOC144098432 [Amblyomma americanum]
MAAEQCLVEFFALEMKRAGGVLRVSHYDTIGRYEKSMPTMLAEFMNTKYNGSLTRFFRSHKDSFVFCENRVGLLPHFEARSILAQPDNLNVVQFFLDLFQKIGATQEQPCSVHILSKYVPYMDHDARLFLRKMYANSLNVFFTLNDFHFHMTSPDRGFVSLRRPPAAPNCIAAQLRKCLLKNNAFNSLSGLNIEELLHEAIATWLPELRLYFGGGNRTSKLYNVLNSYPNVFKWKPHEKVWLRRKYEKWDRKWSGAEELLAAIHFMELLKDIGATLSNPICFNYILCCAESVPKECSAYINHVFPGIDLIDLFHLHPDKFDLSVVNCVSLKFGDQEIETKKSPGALSAYYAAHLLKYAPNLVPDTLKICIENAPKAVKSYCGTTVRHRLHVVLDSGRELLTSGVVDNMMAADLLKSICRTPAPEGNQKKKKSKDSAASTAANTTAAMPKKATTKASKISKTSAMAGPVQGASHLETAASIVPSLTAGSLTLLEKEKLQNTLAKALSLTEMKQDTPALDTSKRFQSQLDTMLIIPTVSARTLQESKEMKPQNSLAKAASLSDLVLDVAVSDTPERSQSLVNTTMLIIPTPTTRSFTDLEELKPQNTVAKALSLTELEQDFAASDTLKRPHLRPFASYSMSLPSQHSPAIPDVARLKNEDRKTKMLMKAKSNPCLIVSKFRELAPVTEKSSSCVELCGDESKLVARIVSHGSTKALSLAVQKQEPRQQLEDKVDEKAKTNETNQGNVCGAASDDYMYSKMEHALSEFITKRLEASPIHSEELNSLSDAVNKSFGVLPKYEIHLAVLYSEGTLSFDGKRVLYNAN